MAVHLHPEWPSAAPAEPGAPGPSCPHRGAAPRRGAALRRMQASRRWAARRPPAHARPSRNSRTSASRSSRRALRRSQSFPRRGRDYRS